MNRPEVIPNSSLKPSDIPPPTADWSAISRFALTFNGYEEAGSLSAAAQIANDHRNDTLTDLRICLFFEQRRWHHFGRIPDAGALDYLHSLLEQIRQLIVEGNLK